MVLEKEINIYIGLTEMQRKWYRSVLEKDIDAVNGLSFRRSPVQPRSLFSSIGLTGKKEGKTRLMNMVMQVRLTTNLRHLSDIALAPKSNMSSVFV